MPKGQKAKKRKQQTLIKNKPKLTLDTINTLQVSDLSSINLPGCQYAPSHYANRPGVEAYALYAYLSRYAHTVADLGTLRGLSALAFTYDQTTQVISYDIDLNKNLVTHPRIKFVNRDAFYAIQDIVKADIVLVDIDPHDGKQEPRMLDALHNAGFNGLSIWDDIHLNSGMRAFWQNVSLPKLDVTNMGHHSGTGIIQHAGTKHGK